VTYLEARTGALFVEFRRGFVPLDNMTDNVSGVERTEKAVVGSDPIEPKTAISEENCDPRSQTTPWSVSKGR
jgi:hypothetical protein